MHIEFIKNHGIYSPGDVAGFERSAAQRLLDKGVAIQKDWADSPVPEVQASELADGAAEKPVRSRRKE